jgi:5'-nucleotidase
MDADIVSLEEIENSVALGEPTATTPCVSSVTALNTTAGITRWAFAPSPRPDLRTSAEQDVIRTAFIFNPDTVTSVGQSEVLVGRPPSPTRVSRWPRPSRPRVPRRRGVRVVVNHFKSKSALGRHRLNADSVTARALQRRPRRRPPTW